MTQRLTFVFLLSFVLGLQMMFAQQTVVASGTVIGEEDGEPLIGAAVKVKGTSQGTITNADGAFSLTVAQDAVLEISYVGYLTQEIKAGRNLSVLLKTDTQNLEEVVVIGYGTQRKKDVTSSISQVKGSEISDKAAPSFLQSMAGRASGVQIISPDGDVTKPPRVIIRGVGTISSSTAPLYIVNGIPVTSGDISGSAYNNALADINPSDIESMEILKDGAATAIYGSRAANGVVLINTKQGKQGNAKLNYEGWVGFSSPSKLHKLLNAQQFVEIANERELNNTPTATPPAVYDGTDTNWYDYVFRTGIQHSHNLSLSGATPKTQYFLSVGFSDQEGINVANGYNRYTFYGRANHTFLKDYVTASFSLNASNQENNGYTQGTNSLSGAMYASQKMLPNVAVYNADDPTGYNIAPDRKSLGQGSNLKPIDLTIPNIMWVLTNNKAFNNSYRLLPNASLEIKPVKWLNYKTVVGADVSVVLNGTTWRPESGDGYGYEGYISRSTYQRTRWNFQHILNFNRDFGVHHVDATAVAEWNNYEYKSFSGSGQHFSDPFFVDELISSTYSTINSGGSYTTNGLTSYIFRANYNWNSIAYLGGSIRRDGISVLHPDNRWGTFVGASAALRISGFDFWKSSSISDIVSDLRLRGSMGEVGNDRLSGDFMYQDFFSSRMYANNVGIWYSQAGNKDLKWETQKITDIGFDAAFLNGRYNLVFAYWRKDNSDIVLDMPTPPSLGIPDNSIAQNYGDIKNDGIEIELGGNIIQQRDLTWKSTLNFSTQHSIVTKLVDDIISSSGFYVIKEGESLNTLWGYRYAGVNMANGNPMYYKADGTTIVQGNIADSKYYVYDPANPNDFSSAKAATLNTDDKVLLGNTLPTWFGGWDNTFNYKDFDLNIFFRFSGGSKIANISRRDLLTMKFVNNGVEMLGRWQSPEKPGDGQTPKQRYGYEGFINFDSSDLTTRWVENSDFLKLQNLAVGYNFPSSLCKTLYVEKARFYVQAQNLLTLTKYKGLDPEIYNGTIGIDYNSNPQQRTLLIGLNIGF
ncbi:MAG: TonB-dependent receptor [Tannerella sp.]|jgi:TonB-linked SusC/RagA family outer membrane protein|nr:TonB-dependent receptor [Tannerella sp.]